MDRYFDSNWVHIKTYTSSNVSVKLDDSEDPDEQEPTVDPGVTAIQSELCSQYCALECVKCILGEQEKGGSKDKECYKKILNNLIHIDMIKNESTSLLTMKQEIIELKDIIKDFAMEGGGYQRVLHGVSFAIKEGEFVSIMGPSGSGKSTCMNIIGALDTPSDGKYYLYGNDTTNMDADELAIARNVYIGFVFQNFNLLARRTVLDNVMLPLMYRGLSINERIDRAMDHIEQVGLGKFINYLPSQLSGGMRQRVAIARALAGSPKLILADEPTGNLDSKMGNEILKMLSDLNKKQGITIVMITHEFDIARYTNRLIHIRDGIISYDGKMPRHERAL